MTLIRTKGLQSLRDGLAQSVPALLKKIHIGRETIRTPRHGYPSLAIIPTRFRPVLEQRKIHKTATADGTGVKVKPTATSLVMDIGRYEGIVQLRLGHRTPAQRAALEDAIEQVFWNGVTYVSGAPVSDPMMYGTVRTRVPSCHEALCCFDMDEDSEWLDVPELSAADKHFTMMNLTAVLPILVTNDNVPTVDEIRLAFSDDFDATFDENLTGDVEVAQVDQTGCLVAPSS